MSCAQKSDYSKYCFGLVDYTRALFSFSLFLFFKLDKQKQDFDWAGSVRRKERAEKTFYKSAKIIYLG